MPRLRFSKLVEVYDSTRSLIDCVSADHARRLVATGSYAGRGSRRTVYALHPVDVTDAAEQTTVRPSAGTKTTFRQRVGDHIVYSHRADVCRRWNWAVP